MVGKKKEATEKSLEVEQNRKVITVEQEEAEDSLRQALPDLENARLALDTLQKKDITEVRSFANPPEPVQIICECVAILKGFKDISWKMAKGMLAEANFLKSLQEMNCDLITVKQVTSCRAHMKVRNMSAALLTAREISHKFSNIHRKPQKWMTWRASRALVSVS